MSVFNHQFTKCTKCTKHKYGDNKKHGTGNSNKGSIHTPIIPINSIQPYWK
jgi:hypothetical protein